MQNKTIRNSQRLRDYAVLHILILIYSFGGVCSKFAGKEKFLSPLFILFYGGLLLSLFIYAIGWQQIIKRMPLTTAYANKATGIVWGIVWGVLIFHESISLQMVIGAVVVITGVVLVAMADE